MGTTFSWTNNNTSIGLPPSGTGNIARFNPPPNLTDSLIDATITVTPIYTSPLVTINDSLVAGDMTEANRLLRDDSKVSTCDSLKPFPGTRSGAHLYDTYNYTNTTGASQCITVSYITNSDSGDVFVSAYNGNFNPNDLSANYLADGGMSSEGTSDPGHGPVTFSCNVANGATVVLVANEVSGSCPSYTITISDFNSGVVLTGPPGIFHLYSRPVFKVSQPDNQVVCNNGNTLPVNITSSPSGLYIGWDNNQPSIGLGYIETFDGFGGIGNIPSFVAHNTTNAPVTATIHVASFDESPGFACLPGPGGLFFRANNLPGSSSKGVRNSDGSLQQETNTVGSKSNPWDNGHGGAAQECTCGCHSPANSFTITVNPTPIVNAVPNQVACNGASTSPVNFSSPTTGGTLVYNWTNDNPGVGLAASGTGNIASFLPVNNTAFPVTATITVTPSFTNAGLTCTGTPITFTITVNPIPDVKYFVTDPPENSSMVSISPQLGSDCCGNTIIGNTVDFTGSVIGTTFSWTNNNTSIGLPASGTGNIPAFKPPPNLTNNIIDATITVTPLYTSPLVTINGSLVAGDMTEPGRLFRDDSKVSTCDSQKPFPGSIPGTHLYDTYTYTNTTGASQCITVSYITNSDRRRCFCLCIQW